MRMSARSGHLIGSGNRISSNGSSRAAQSHSSMIHATLSNGGHASSIMSLGAAATKSRSRAFYITSIALLGGSSALLSCIGVWMWRYVQRRRTAMQAARSEHLHTQSLLNQQHDIWDVIIVGSGPAGATCAYYCAVEGLRVLLLDRDRFPRDKICGDQVHTQAQHILKDMGVLQQLLTDDVVKWAVNRGVVSPDGHSFVGEIKEKEGLFSVQRVILDEKIVEAATRAGTEFRDGCWVKAAVFDRTHSIWTIDVLDAAQLPSADSIVEKPAPAELVRHSCRVLVCADGAVSGLARSLQGLTPAESPASVIGHANSIGGRAFAKRHTHDCRADEVIFYPQHLLPGHLRMSGELDDYLNITCFVLPHPDSGSQPFSNALSPNVLQEKFVSVTENEPWIRTALGPRCKLSRLQTAPLRVGGVPRSYFPNGMIVGDAAGHQDPLTGDGIQYGMQGARLASKTIIDAFRQNDFSLRRFKQYEKAWKSLFGWDFFWAKGIMYFMAQFPRLIDAVIVVIQRKGSQAILFWALARSGVKSKMDVILWFLRPDTFWEIVWRWISLWAQQEF